MAFEAKVEKEGFFQPSFLNISVKADLFASASLVKGRGTAHSAVEGFTNRNFSLAIPFFDKKSARPIWDAPDFSFYTGYLSRFLLSETVQYAAQTAERQSAAQHKVMPALPVSGDLPPPDCGFAPLLVGSEDA